MTTPFSLPGPRDVPRLDLRYELDPELMAKLRRPRDWWDRQIVLVPRWRRCTIRVLVVTDGNGCHFGSGGWGLSIALGALQHDLPPWVHISVTKAHHASSSVTTQAQDPAADIVGLRFDSVDLSDYDQVWFFATASQGGGSDALTDGEVAQLWAFMQAGGGIFATGDHEDLGEALCGGIPRVATMRLWRYGAPAATPEQPEAPAAFMAGFGENDTITGGSEFDGVPQAIVPAVYSNSLSLFFRREYPHPLLCGADGRVTVLPDHMHEGQCLIPPDLGRTVSPAGTPEREYPDREGTPYPPDVIATSSINRSGAPVVGVIGAYDGHAVTAVTGGVGRVVVDSTWHHWFDMNTEQFSVPHAAVAAAARDGRAPAPSDDAPAAAWEQIRDYMQNVALWLAPPALQRCLRRRGLWLLAHHVDVLMVLRDRTRELDVDRLVLLGTRGRDAFGRVAPQCEQIRLVFDLPIRWFEVMRPWPGPPPEWRKELEDILGPARLPLLDGRMLEDLQLGAALVAMHRALGDVDADEADNMLDDDRLDDRIADVVLESVRLLAKRVVDDGERLARVLEWGAERRER